MMKVELKIKKKKVAMGLDRSNDESGLEIKG